MISEAMVSSIVTNSILVVMVMCCVLQHLEWRAENNVDALLQWTPPEVRSQTKRVGHMGVRNHHSVNMPRIEHFSTSQVGFQG